MTDTYGCPIKYLPNQKDTCFLKPKMYSLTKPKQKQLMAIVAGILQSTKKKKLK